MNFELVTRGNMTPGLFSIVSTDKAITTCIIICT